jgi:hypothetical protein
MNIDHSGERGLGRALRIEQHLCDPFQHDLVVVQQNLVQQLRGIALEVVAAMLGGVGERDFSRVAIGLDGLPQSLYIGLHRPYTTLDVQVAFILEEPVDDG